MVIQSEVMTGAEPYSAKGDRRGALVIHGFTGCPQSMRPLAEALAAAGFTVELPRLPGHGTTVEDMANYSWKDWAAAVEDAFRELSSRTDSIVVAGLSMGGTLTLWLASRHPEIRGIVLVNPAVQSDDFAGFVEGANAALAAGDQFLPGVAGDIADPNSKELGYDKAPAAALISLIDGMREVKESLSSIKMPVLLMHSLQDHIVPPGTSALLRETFATNGEYVPLERSFHVATIDFEMDEINERATAFAKSVCT